MKPSAIEAALPLLKERITLGRHLERAQTYYAKASLVVDDTCGSPVVPVSIEPRVAQGILQTMIDAVEADLRALGVDLT